jgi:CubicO group peptidase (beta-lactamase class C family)
LASLTKIFTATAVMMLVDEGRLSLDSRARDVIPTLPQRWSHVTVRQLLAHTSGVPDYLEYLSESQGQYPARDEVLKRMGESLVDFPPGEKLAYNQTDYVILGMIIGKVTGRAYPQFLRERVFVPLRMRATAFGDARNVMPGLKPRWYVWQDGAWGYLDGPRYPTWAYPAAGLNSTASDLAKFDAALQGGRIIRSTSL